MASRSVLRSLMTGAAVASLSTAALADGWNSLIVFGGRNYDSGQYISNEAVFADEDDEVGDARQRATNIVAGGGRGRVISQRVSDALGFGETNPSQPQSYGDYPTPPDGWNYATTFYSSADIRDSIISSARTGSVNYLDPDGTTVNVPGRTRPGLLNDPDRSASAWGALVLVDSAQLDLRATANIERDLDSEVDLNSSFIFLDPDGRDYIAYSAASNIATGVTELTHAGAGLVVVSNAYNSGATPEVGGDNSLLEEADTILSVRENEAETSENEAQAAEAIFDTASATALAAEINRDTIGVLYDAALLDSSSTPAQIADLEAQLSAAQIAASDADAVAAARATEAQEARAEADRLALTSHEIALRPQIDAAIADPDLIGDTRTAATDTYNASLLQQLRGVDGNILLIDQRALFDAIIADPARFGLSDEFDQANDCLDSSPLYPCNEVNASVEELLFTNGIELTETGHQLAADQITAMLSAPEILSGIPAIGISAARGIADTVRDQTSREQSWKAGVAPFVSGVASRVQLNKSQGYSQHDGGFYSGVAGLKYVLANGIVVGAAGGYQKVTTPGDSASLKYDGSALFGTAFAGVNSGPLFGNLTATYGKIDYGDVTRISQIGAAKIRNRGDAEGTVKGVTAEAGLRLLEYDILRAGPIANFSHWRSEVDGYAENGWAATAVSTNDLETVSTRAGVGMFLEAGSLIDGTGSVFRAKALYGHEFGDETATASVTPLGANSVGSFSTQVRGVSKAPLELGAEVVLGFRGILTTFGYDGILGDVSDHRFRVGASMPL